MTSGDEFDELICPEMRGMALVEDTGWLPSRSWMEDDLNIYTVNKNTMREACVRSSYRLAYRHGIEDWPLDGGWGGTLMIFEDDGSAVVVIRASGNMPEVRRALVFATSLAFWVKITLKHRCANK